MTIISINGVPATDTLAFMGEVRRVVENDYSRVENALESQAHLDVVCPHDRWEGLAFREAVSWCRVYDESSQRRFWRRVNRFPVKRKEVK